MMIGPDHPDGWWMDHKPDGDCGYCGSDCAPECGTHPAGCTFGGMGYGYWIYDPECPRYHGEEATGGSGQ